MSDDDNFLSRWSRRKRAVAKSEEPDSAAAPEAARPVKPKDEAPQPNAPEPEDTEVDLSNLPSLESITGSTDITGFLRRGVPDELSRSALRKAWASDPMIRDFIGIAENQWDFNDPASIPGFGAIDLAPEQVRQMAAKLVGDVQDAAEKIDEALKGAAQADTAPQQTAADQVATADVEINELSTSPPAAIENKNFAAQHEEQNSSNESPKPRRHGGALPR